MSSQANIAAYNSITTKIASQPKAFIARRLTDQRFSFPAPIQIPLNTSRSIAKAKAFAEFIDAEMPRRCKFLLSKNKVVLPCIKISSTSVLTTDIDF